MNMLRCILSVVFLGITSSNADTLSYLRFEEGSGYGAYDETGLMNGFEPTQGHQVVGDQNGCGLVWQRQQFLHGLATAIVAVIGAADQGLV